MKHKRITAGILAALLLGIFAGCAQGTSTAPAAPAYEESVSLPQPVETLVNTNEPAAAPPVKRYLGEAAALLNPRRASEGDETAKLVASGANRFSLRLSGAMVSEDSDENFICSPYSVWLPMAALLNATDEAHRGELLAALSVEGITEANINRAASRMLFDLTGERNRARGLLDKMQVANAVFVGQGQALNGDFAQLFLDYYRGQVFEVDFASSDAVAEINRWASENTEGLITDLVQEFDPQTAAALANAIYFSDRWKYPFNPDLTAEGVFHAPGADTMAMFMQLERNGLSYYEDDRLQAVALPFASQGSLYILLPRDGDASGLLASLDEAYYQTIRDSRGERTGKLLLPRFTITSSVMDLKGVLCDLGVPLFDEDAAPLTGLLAETGPLYLSVAVQKAIIKVDETGTTAAAVTIAPPPLSAGPEPTVPFEMICDKPFVFLLCDYTYDGGEQILFTGVVNQPR